MVFALSFHPQRQVVSASFGHWENAHALFQAANANDSWQIPQANEQNIR